MMECSKESRAEYNRKKDTALRNEDIRGECDILGRMGQPNREETYKYMMWRMPRLKQFRMFRAVAERIDLTPEAKLVHAVLMSFGTHPRLYRAEIAGLCGLSMRAVSSALYDLQAEGLIYIKKNYYTVHRAAPSTFIMRKIHARDFSSDIPKVFSYHLDFDKLERVLRDRFEI